MKRIYVVNELFDYIGSSICHKTQESAICYAENVNHFGDDYYYHLEEKDDGYIVRFYSFNYKKAFLDLKEKVENYFNNIYK